MDPLLRVHWDQNKTLKQNYESMGLTLNLKPNLRHTKEGQDLIKEVRQRHDQTTTEIGMAALGLKISENKKEKPTEHVMKRDYNEVFPGVFKAEKDITYNPSVAKLRGDDLLITTKLHEKYGEDIDRMFLDIKTNYLQWSKGELAKKLKALKVHHLN